MAAFLGIDFGTSGARAIVVDHQGQILAESSQLFTPQDSLDWCGCWQNTLTDLLADLPMPIRANLQAIAVNGTSGTVILCDRQGQPLDHPLLYNEERGFAVQSSLEKLVPPNHLARSSSSSLAKLLWWSEQTIFSEAHYFLHQADWLGFLLHGKLGFSDYHNALKLGYDVQQLSYPDWLKNTSFREILPQVLTPGTAIAPLKPDLAQQFQINPHCLICAGTTDSIAAFFASGANQPGEAVTSLGSTLVLKLLSRTYIEDLSSGVYSHRWGDLWLTGGASNVGGTVLKQFFSDQELIDLSSQIDPQMISPYDYYPLPKIGDRFPVNDPQLSPRLEPRPSQKVDFLQAILEGLAKIEAMGYQKLQGLGATPLTRIYTAGGGAKNATWRAMRSRYCQVPILLSPQTEAAYGTAWLASQSFHSRT